MKKHFNPALAKVAVLCLATAVMSSCDDQMCIKGEGPVEQRELQLQPFDAIDANGDFKVYITQGSPQKVEVKGESNILSDLRTDIESGTWKIAHRSCVRRSETVEVYITLPEVSALRLNGSGRISASNTLETEELQLDLNGSGRMNLEVETDELIAHTSGSGEITLRGEADKSAIVMSGSGKVAAYDLQSKDVSVKLSGSGRAEVAASSTLTVDISGSGSVHYMGNPSVNTQISGSGKVVKR